MSTKEAAELQDFAEDAGVEDFMPQPFTAAVLVDKVDRLINA